MRVMLYYPTSFNRDLGQYHHLYWGTEHNGQALDRRGWLYVFQQNTFLSNIADVTQEWLLRIYPIMSPPTPKHMVFCISWFESPGLRYSGKSSRRETNPMSIQYQGFIEYHHRGCDGQRKLSFAFLYSLIVVNFWVCFEAVLSIFLCRIFVPMCHSWHGIFIIHFRF